MYENLKVFQERNAPMKDKVLAISFHFLPSFSSVGHITYAYISAPLRVCVYEE